MAASTAAPQGVTEADLPVIAPSLSPIVDPSLSHPVSEPDPVIVRSNAIADVEVFVANLWYDRQDLCQKMYFDLFPSDKRSPTKAEQDACMLMYFTSQQLHQLGGDFLWTAIVQIAHWNGHFISDFVAKWISKEENKEIWTDPKMLEHLCSPNSSYQAYFSKEERGHYCEAFLQRAAVELRNNLGAHAAALTQDQSAGKKVQETTAGTEVAEKGAGPVIQVGTSELAAAEVGMCADTTEPGEVTPTQEPRLVVAKRGRSDTPSFSAPSVHLAQSISTAVPESSIVVACTPTHQPTPSVQVRQGISRLPSREASDSHTGLALSMAARGALLRQQPQISAPPGMSYMHGNGSTPTSWTGPPVRNLSTPYRTPIHSPQIQHFPAMHPQTVQQHPQALYQQQFASQANQLAFGTAHAQFGVWPVQQVQGATFGEPYNTDDQGTRRHIGGHTGRGRGRGRGRGSLSGDRSQMDPHSYRRFSSTNSNNNALYDGGDRSSSTSDSNWRNNENRPFPSQDRPAYTGPTPETSHPGYQDGNPAHFQLHAGSAGSYNNRRFSQAQSERPVFVREHRSLTPIPRDDPDWGCTQYFIGSRRRDVDQLFLNGAPDSTPAELALFLGCDIRAFQIRNTDGWLITLNNSSDTRKALLKHGDFLRGKAITVQVSKRFWEAKGGPKFTYRPPEVARAEILGHATPQVYGRDWNSGRSFSQGHYPVATSMSHQASSSRSSTHGIYTQRPWDGSQSVVGAATGRAADRHGSPPKTERKASKMAKSSVAGDSSGTNTPKKKQKKNKSSKSAKVDAAAPFNAPQDISGSTSGNQRETTSNNDTLTETSSSLPETDVKADNCDVIVELSDIETEMALNDASAKATLEESIRSALAETAVSPVPTSTADRATEEPTPTTEKVAPGEATSLADAITEAKATVAAHNTEGVVALQTPPPVDRRVSLTRTADDVDDSFTTAAESPASMPRSSEDPVDSTEMRAEAETKIPETPVDEKSSEHSSSVRQHTTAVAPHNDLSATQLVPESQLTEPKAGALAEDSIGASPLATPQIGQSAPTVVNEQDGSLTAKISTKKETPEPANLPKTEPLKKTDRTKPGPKQTEALSPFARANQQKKEKKAKSMRGKPKEKKDEKVGVKDKDIEQTNPTGTKPQVGLGISVSEGTDEPSATDDLQDQSQSSESTKPAGLTGLLKKVSAAFTGAEKGKGKAKIQESGDEPIFKKLVESGIDSQQPVTQAEGPQPSRDDEYGIAEPGGLQDRYRPAVLGTKIIQEDDNVAAHSDSQSDDGASKSRNEPEAELEASSSALPGSNSVNFVDEGSSDSPSSQETDQYKLVDDDDSSSATLGGTPTPPNMSGPASPELREAAAQNSDAITPHLVSAPKKKNKKKKKKAKSHQASEVTTQGDGDVSVSKAAMQLVDLFHLPDGSSLPVLANVHAFKGREPEGGLAGSAESATAVMSSQMKLQKLEHQERMQKLMKAGDEEGMAKEKERWELQMNQAQKKSLGKGLAALLENSGVSTSPYSNSALATANFRLLNLLPLNEEENPEKAEKLRKEKVNAYYGAKDMNLSKPGNEPKPKLNRPGAKRYFPNKGPLSWQETVAKTEGLEEKYARAMEKLDASGVMDQEEEEETVEAECAKPVAEDDQELENADGESVES